MKPVLLLLAPLLLGGCMSLADYGEAPGAGWDRPPAAADWWGRDVGSVDVFVGALGPYGRWTAIPGYGRVWQPAGIGYGWEPYARGRWVHDPRWGRRWDTAEPFGWATYHYGRWVRDPRLGWFWLPDTRFAPGWASFDRGPSWIGWGYPAGVRPGWGGYPGWGQSGWGHPGWGQGPGYGRPHRPVQPRPDRPPVAAPELPDRREQLRAIWGTQRPAPAPAAGVAEQTAPTAVPRQPPPGPAAAVALPQRAEPRAERPQRMERTIAPAPAGRLESGAVANEP